MDVRPRITVVGSFIMDLIVRAPRRPVRGETLIGKSFDMAPGGKGVNQAVAAARLNADVTMVGRLGQDAFGDTFLNVLKEEGIKHEYVSRDETEGTGVGTPVVDDEGDNSIIIIPRANANLSVADIEKAGSAIAESDVLLLQLEVPISASMQAAAIASKSDTCVILNPAPARDIPDSFIRVVDVMIPNEIEFKHLTGFGVASLGEVKQGAEVLASRGVQNIIVTLGERGAFLIQEKRIAHVPPCKVDKVVDTTGAGDAFCGTLAVCIARGMPLGDAVVLANRAGAYAVTRLGAIPSLPGASELGIG